jgi:GAF domain
MRTIEEHDAYDRRDFKGQIMPSTENQGTAAKAAKVEIGDLERMVSESPSCERACLKLAQVLRVRRSEIALMRLEKGSLRFIYPAELRSAGVLPLSGSAVAARTAATRTPLLSNAFMRVKHVSLFEAVKLSGGEEDQSLEQMPIQKIMSVPVASGVAVMGVVQVSRKGLDASLAGPDFQAEDLRLLEKAADILAKMPFMKEGAEL